MPVLYLQSIKTMHCLKLNQHTLWLACLLTVHPQSQATDNETWKTLELEFSNQVLHLGSTSDFDLHNVSFEVDIQMLSDAASPDASTSPAYLTENGLVDRASPAALLPSNPQHLPDTSVFKQVITGADQAQLEISYVIESVDLAGTSLGKSAMLIGAALQSQQPKNPPTFGPGARCLTQTGKSMDRPAFYFSRQRASPFKSIQAFITHRKQDLGRKIVTTDEGIWNGNKWAKVQALNYKNQRYYTGAVEWSGSIYLASFLEKGSNTNALRECIAYNPPALDAILSHFKR